MKTKVVKLSITQHGSFLRVDYFDHDRLRVAAICRNLPTWWREGGSVLRADGFRFDLPIRVVSQHIPYNVMPSSFVYDCFSSALSDHVRDLYMVY